ncbi:6-phosphofructokinase [Gilvimarinus sp. SDUM040013]|uniref:Pyrophosphate--fructose 6-phosphate 1-phosphotransferase n=1 Tax=Gilvimarinus gilvus TaxID=3058038 RepID=A0ABU4RX44_9GAMM|nr:6-phosphofructokinase [Gilvimarinus sp. SDUM040013]MDO3386680.1 6-phosphofructokinase [Gilvimarinus sp. SDUM040013]MDX6849433.1 6-phosphofructokinase [Gilvimarinus sp. SDUM040013]
MTKYNAFYGQSGGVTAVINATAAGVIDTARTHCDRIGSVYAGVNGIVGALNEELVDIGQESSDNLAGLLHTPSGAFGSCRFKLQDLTAQRAEYVRLLEVFKAHDIRYFFYNGGGDSQDTTHKLSQCAKEMGYPLTCVGIPKTIDNDLPLTDNSPGFGSVAKYVAISALEASYDVESMHSSSTKVFIMEVMGRHTGWIAAASCLAQDERGLGPDLILVPEVVFDKASFLARVDQVVAEKGFCVVVVAEGIKAADGKFISESGSTDAFGHTQLGGVAPRLVDLIKQNLSYKCHWAVCDYLQRSARHIASQVDVDQAYAVGRAAAEYALQGRDSVMPAIVRDEHPPYSWTLTPVLLSDVANREKAMPEEYISEDGFGVTEAGRAYFAPLIQGEAHPPYENGLPAYVRMSKSLVRKKLASHTPQNN